MAQSTLTIEANQWYEHGYIYRDGVVMLYETDRKEQTNREFDAQPLAEFVADERNPPAVREWARCFVEAT